MGGVAFLLMFSFIVFNGIPDLVFALEQTDETYHAVSVLWSLGYLLDPLIYIFTSKEMRKIACEVVVNMLCCWKVHHHNCCGCVGGGGVDGGCGDGGDGGDGGGCGVW